MFAMMARVSGPTFKTSLEQVARSVGIVQDYRHAEVRPRPTHTTGPPTGPHHRSTPPVPSTASTLTTRSIFAASTLPHKHSRSLCF